MSWRGHGVKAKVTTNLARVGHGENTGAGVLELALGRGQMEGRGRDEEWDQQVLVGEFG